MDVDQLGSWVEAFEAFVALLCDSLYISIALFTGDRSKLRHGDPSSLGAGWATCPVQTQLSDCYATSGQRGPGQSEELWHC